MRGRYNFLESMAQTVLDAIDRRILEVLQERGRLPNTELADEVGLTPAPCLRRVKRLEDEGIISRYVALLDAKKIGRELTVFVHVTLDKQTKRGFTTFAEKMRARPEVLECYFCLGEYDFLLKVVVPDLATYQRFLVDVLAAMPEVSNTNSTIAAKQEKHTTRLPLE